MLKFFVILILKFYRLFLSPLKPKTCRFFPSCSEYAIDAVSKYGMFKGLFLGIKRLIRCHPFGDFGYDPLDKEMQSFKE